MSITLLVLAQVEASIIGLVEKVGVPGAVIIIMGVTFYLYVRATTAANAKQVLSLADAQQTLNEEFESQNKERRALNGRIQTLEDERRITESKLSAAERQNTENTSKLASQEREIKRLEARISEQDKSLFDLKKALNETQEMATVNENAADTRYQAEKLRGDDLEAKNKTLQAEVDTLKKRVEALETDNSLLRKGALETPMKPPAVPAEPQPITGEGDKGTG